MRTTTRPIGESWPVVRFPSFGQRQEFLDLVRLWNRLEDLEGIEAEALGNGVGVRVRWPGQSDRGLLRLIAAFGGRLGPAVAAPVPVGSAETRAAIARSIPRKTMLCSG